MSNFKHGHTKKGWRTSEYAAWNDMKQRCLNPNNPEYKNYGERGIGVHDSFMAFEGFIKELGPKPSPQHSLDRIDNNWDYEPGNVRWATKSEQRNNQRKIGRVKD